ncbi:hypothetical protein [Nocardia sp. alder85J]|uniref:hypothetical protein n=1 Tax=Nocardia sp. alder85J TaxID=2862949 RepID=UPI001CD3845B|nr:hypothetical protein [Nocardia sp. alder85J]MCX4094577.1 hypothetical protein [Nocardia sp. alder85J]
MPGSLTSEVAGSPCVTGEFGVVMCAAWLVRMAVGWAARFDLVPARVRRRFCTVIGPQAAEGIGEGSESADRHEFVAASGGDEVR